MSDGITEAEDAQGEAFGDERLDSASLCGELPGVLSGWPNSALGIPPTTTAPSCRWFSAEPAVTMRAVPRASTRIWISIFPRLR